MDTTEEEPILSESKGSMLSGQRYSKISGKLQTNLHNFEPRYSRPLAVKHQSNLDCSRYENFMEPEAENPANRGGQSEIKNSLAQILANDGQSSKNTDRHLNLKNLI